MTETQAASEAAAAEASTSPAGAEAADGGDNAGGTATGRAVVGRAAVPGEAPAQKFTRPAGMVPPPDKLESPEKASGTDKTESKDSKTRSKDSSDGIAQDAETAPITAAAAHPTGRASVPATARVSSPAAGATGTVPAPGTSASSTPTAVTSMPTGLKTGRVTGTGRVSALGGTKVGEAVRAARAAVSSAASRGPRRARLFVKRIDPWSVMKFSFAMSFVLFFVAIVATSVLYLALDAMGVFRSLNKMLADMLGATGGKSTFKITALDVIGTAGVLGLVNVVLFTALATLSAFVYNVCADLVGGIEVTLSEKD